MLLLKTPTAKPANSAPLYLVAISLPLDGLFHLEFSIQYHSQPYFRLQALITFELSLLSFSPQAVLGWNIRGKDQSSPFQIPVPLQLPPPPPSPPAHLLPFQLQPYTNSTPPRSRKSRSIRPRRLQLYHSSYSRISQLPPHQPRLPTHLQQRRLPLSLPIHAHATPLRQLVLTDVRGLAREDPSLHRMGVHRPFIPRVA